MRLAKILISFGVACALAIGISLFSSWQAEAQSSQRPYVVFVNGWQNCCAWGMDSLQTRLISQMNAEPRYVPYSTFRADDKSNSTENDSAFLQEGANFINNKLDKNRPLIIVGHSFGGDSVLKLLPRINRRIQFVAVLDPVSTGGFRSSLSGVPSNVDYFFNRWQQNVPFPTDFVRSGSLQCSAKICDQVEQQFATDADSKIIRHWKGMIRGWENERSTHQGLPTDAGVQNWLGDRISEQLAAFKPNENANKDAGLGFYRQQDRPEVYLVWRPGSYCHVKTDDQMKAYGGIGNVKVVDSLKLNGEFAGACGWPDGFFRRSNQLEIYRMYDGGGQFNLGNSFCHVANEDQMNAYGGPERVRVVSPRSDLARGRDFTGDCPNP